MATTKKTTAKKAAAPKKANKPAVANPAEQLEVIPKAPEPVKPVQEEMGTDVIPRDPSFEAEDQFFEWNLNGINYRFKRGETLTHPRSFFDAISEKLQLREHRSPEIAAFMDPKGKKLN
jgi:hypothetical protein